MRTPYLTLLFGTLLTAVYVAGCGFEDCVAFESLALATTESPASYRTLAYVLSHSSWFHLFMNLLGTLPLMIIFEAVHGPIRVAVLVAASAYFGSLNFLWNNSYGSTATRVVGASAITYGLAGAYIQSIFVHGAWHRHTRRKLLARVLLLLGQVLIEVAIILYASKHVATTAHLGGLLAGFTGGLAVLSGRYVTGTVLGATCIAVAKFAF